MASTFMRLPVVIARTGLSKSSIYTMVALGSFPRPRKIGARMSAWVDAEVQAWIDARIRGDESSAQRIWRKSSVREKDRCSTVAGTLPVPRRQRAVP